MSITQPIETKIYENKITNFFPREGVVEEVVLKFQLFDWY